MAEINELQAMAQTNANFSRAFYKVLGDHEGNLIASPLSAHLVLILAQLGARGATQEEMKVGLHLPDDVEVVKSGIRSLLDTLQSSPKVILEIANRMYVKHGFPLHEEFTTAAEKSFSSSVESVEFENPATRTNINNWVAKTTHDKIKDLIPHGVLDAMTRLVLVNAVYFKGPWLKPFNPDRTEPQPFYTDETNTVEMPFMYQKSHFGYAKLDSLDAELIEMPYEGNQLSLVVLLPRSRTGLKELEKKMETQDLSALLQTAGRREIELYFPKFKLEVTLRLNDYLKRMGLGRMFSDTADFSGITSAESLVVSHVLQKAFIEISEEGTEAAAATGMIMATMSAMIVPAPVVRANRPFTLYLVSRAAASTHLVLFAGRLVEPTPA